MCIEFLNQSDKEVKYRFWTPKAFHKSLHNLATPMQEVYLVFFVCFFTMHTEQGIKSRGDTKKGLKQEDEIQFKHVSLCPFHAIIQNHAEMDLLHVSFP